MERRVRQRGWLDAAWFVGVVLLVALLAWVVDRRPSSTSSASVFPPQPAPAMNTLGPEDGAVMGICINSPNPSDIATWTKFTDVVVIGTVVKIGAPRWTTEDGTRPARPYTGGEIIYTPVVVEVEQYLKGEQPTHQIGVLARDGRIGQDRMDYCGDTRYVFAQGERVVLFLSASPSWDETYAGLPLWDVGEHFSVIEQDQVITGPRLGGSLDAPLPKVLADIQAALQP